VSYLNTEAQGDKERADKDIKRKDAENALRKTRKEGKKMWNKRLSYGH
jgi:hypothetical protein